jgi:hypothetical protein
MMSPLVFIAVVNRLACADEVPGKTRSNKQIAAGTPNWTFFRRTARYDTTSEVQRITFFRVLGQLKIKSIRGS